MGEKATLNETVYSGIKSELLAGTFWPGERLESRAFEARFDTSSTPIRMALSRLAGERLLDITALDGFHVPHVSESWLYDIYIANREALLICLRLAHKATSELTMEVFQTAGTVEATETLFNDVASTTGNVELISWIAGLNERLRTVRLIEGSALPDRQEELASLAGLWMRRDERPFARGVQLYHERRIDRLRDLVQSVSRRRK